MAGFDFSTNSVLDKMLWTLTFLAGLGVMSLVGLLIWGCYLLAQHWRYFR